MIKKIIFFSEIVLDLLIILLIIINIFFDKNEFLLQIKDIMINIIVPLAILHFFLNFRRLFGEKRSKQ